MYVVKRTGEREKVQLWKIQRRIEVLCEGLPDGVDPVEVALQVVRGVHDGVLTSELDDLAAETAQALTTHHPDYGLLAGRIAVSNLHKRVPEAFSAMVARANSGPSLILDADFAAWVAANAAALDAMVRHDRDYTKNLFAVRSLERSYLLREESEKGKKGAILERPQHMLMRVAVCLCMPDLDAIRATYDALSLNRYIHGTPTLFNAGTSNPQMASCFLLDIKEDSIEGIFDTLKTVAQLSKYAGGIGLGIHEVRSKGSFIRGTNGTSNGIVPMLKVFNDTARYVDQGGGKRKGAFAVYVEPWNADIMDFLELKRPHVKEELRVPDLFYAMWLEDEFMERVAAGRPWSLFCPREAPGLSDVHGDEFRALYARYEAQEHLARRVLPARQVWDAIIECIQESGVPYLLSKSAVNRHNNHAHLGTITRSNLCAEIVQYARGPVVAVCNLASIALGECVAAAPKLGAGTDKPKAAPYFDFDALTAITRLAITNLDAAIDRTYYAVPAAAESNLQERPVGLGVQGLADVFFKLRLPFSSPEARALNRDIFEAMYFAALDASCDLAAAKGFFPSWPATRAAREGVLQVDTWGVATPDTPRHNWTALRARIARHGLRNSMLTALMPTATTAQLLGNTEAFEPVTSNVFSRRVLSGDFIVVNKYLVEDLMAAKLWTPAMRNALIAMKGSVARLKGVSPELKALYATAWEISMKVVIDMAADRAPYIDQSQSMNLYSAGADKASLTSMFMYGWRKGLKTISYYTRTKGPSAPLAFTVDADGARALIEDEVTDVTAPAAATTEPAPAPACKRRPRNPDGTFVNDDDDNVCEACSA
jgi:ribonucleoside-diphosphate reductase alpha chain